MNSPGNGVWGFRERLGCVAIYSLAWLPLTLLMIGFAGSVGGLLRAIGTGLVEVRPGMILYAAASLVWVLLVIACVAGLVIESRGKRS